MGCFHAWSWEGARDGAKAKVKLERVDNANWMLHVIVIRRGLHHGTKLQACSGDDKDRDAWGLQVNH